MKKARWSTHAMMVTCSRVLGLACVFSCAAPYVWSVSSSRHFTETDRVSLASVPAQGARILGYTSPKLPMPMPTPSCWNITSLEPESDSSSATNSRSRGILPWSIQFARTKCNPFSPGRLPKAHQLVLAAQQAKTLSQTHCLVPCEPLPAVHTLARFGMSLRRSISSRRKSSTSDGDHRMQELLRIRLAKPLRVGFPMGTWVGRLDSKSKLRIVWKIAFGPKGQQHAIACTVSRKSKKREVFFDGDLVHSGALGLLESVGGVAADTTLFEHKWDYAGRSFCVSERVFVREGVPFPPDSEDPLAAVAAREAARFEVAIDGTLFHLLDDIDSLSLSEREVVEMSLNRAIASYRSKLHRKLQVTGVSDSNSISLPCTFLSMKPNMSEKALAPPFGEHLEDKHHPSTQEVLVPQLPQRKFQPWTQDMTSGADVERQSRNTDLAIRKQRCTVVDNGFAARIECVLGPGILGQFIVLKNDATGVRVEVESATGEAQEIGVAAGDILISLNGRMLPPKLDAIELMSLLQENPRYMLSEVAACLWRRRANHVEYNGTHVTTRLDGDSSTQLELSCLERSVPLLMAAAERESEHTCNKSPFVLESDENQTAREYLAMKLQGHYIVTRTAFPCSNGSVRCGDVVVGFDYTPVPRFATATAMAQTADGWAVAGKLSLHLWRHLEASSADFIAKLASNASRSILMASPSEIAAVACEKETSVRGTATIGIAVLADYGIAKQTKTTDRPEFCANVRASSIDHVPSTTSTATSADQERERLIVNELGFPHGTNPELMTTMGADLGSGDDREFPSSAHDSLLRGDHAKTHLLDNIVGSELHATQDAHYGVIKRLLQSGATLDGIVTEMRAAGVSTDKTRQIMGSLRLLVSKQTSSVHSIDEHVEATGESPKDARSAMLASIKNRRIASDVDTCVVKISTSPRAGALTATLPLTTTPPKITVAELDATLSRYRKMVKLGVPAASVRQRMRLDQVEKCAVRSFAAENGLEDDELDVVGLMSADKKTSPGKRAKLHWDAMTLDDRALAVSVWAADALGGDDIDNCAVGAKRGATSGPGKSSDLLDDDDVERLATLFSDAENSAKYRKSASAIRLCQQNAPLTMNGKSIVGVRILDPQRSQNMSITIAPLIRIYDGVDKFLCSIARLDAGRASLEQLETLLAAMPSRDEIITVANFVKAAQHTADSSELDTLDAAIARDARFMESFMQEDSLFGDVLQSNHPGGYHAYGEQDVQQGDLTQHEPAVEREGICRKLRTFEDLESRQMIRVEYVVRHLPPAERFVHSVSRVELALLSLRQCRAAAAHQHEVSPVSLANRLEALVSLLSIQPGTQALAEKADICANAARALVASRSLAKLLQHVLAAGNAVNAGSVKADASAVRLSSLLQAARTKGTDGKTTLLDGVVGLLLDRADRKQQQQKQDARSVSPHIVPDCDNGPQQANEPVASDGVSPGRQGSAWLAVGKDEVVFRDDLLDFPENDGLLVCLESIRGADERVLIQEAAKFEDSLAVAAKEIKLVLRELDADATDDKGHRPTQDSAKIKNMPRRDVWQVFMQASIGKRSIPRGSSADIRLLERDRLMQLEHDATKCTISLDCNHMRPLEIAVTELRAYFACEKNESLDSIFATLRDFMRALCDSRDAQRRHRRAAKRKAERKLGKLAAENSARNSSINDCELASITTSEKQECQSTINTKGVPCSSKPVKSTEGTAMPRPKGAPCSKPIKSTREGTAMRRAARPPSHPYVS